MSLHDVLIPIQRETDELERVMLGLLSSRVPFVQSVAEHTLKNGGKRLRPILTILCAKISGFSGDAAYRMGSCIEFVHTASLLHDDVVDNAGLRRGKPSANVRWGNHVSVLVGDFFYCRASQLLTEQGDIRILKTVTDAITALTEGEVMEITKNLDLATSEADYLAIIRNKTALLFAAACLVGAILGNVSTEYENALQAYGLNLGMAFQLGDDALDYTAPEEVSGKESGADLKEGKLTLPLLAAIRKADPTERQKIKNALIAEKLDGKTFQEIHSIIVKYDGINEAYRAAERYVALAKESLTPFRPSIEKDILLYIADYVLARDR